MIVATWVTSTGNTSKHDAVVRAFDGGPITWSVLGSGPSTHANDG
jgi:hypothetical protein